MTLSNIRMILYQTWQGQLSVENHQILNSQKTLHISALLYSELAEVSSVGIGRKLTHEDLENEEWIDVYIYASLNWIITGSANGLSYVISFYPNQCWFICNRTLGNKLQWNLNQNTIIFIQEYASETLVKCEPFCSRLNVLTHQAEWCIVNYAIIASDNGFSLVRPQGIILTNAVYFLNELLQTNFSEIFNGNLITVLWWDWALYY